MTSKTKFSKAIAEAASYEDFNVPNKDPAIEPNEGIAPNAPPRPTQRPQNERQALDEARQAFPELAKSIGDKHGVSVIFQPPRISRKRNSAEYSFWKKPIMGFIESPETLDLGPTALEKMYAPTEANFKVTRDTFRAPLSAPSRKAAGQLLKSRGHNLKLPPKFTIDDVRKAMKFERDRAAGIQKFKSVIEIVGNTIRCNGKTFAMQPRGDDKKRIRVGDAWLPVEPLIAFLSSKSANH